ncbi:pentapeptide repeat-containing protein [Desulfurobacterium crinifex]
MEWRVIYLDGKDGREFKGCRVCQEIGRNVIEPVAVFLRENQKLEDLSREDLEKFDTCIFHCEKKNEIWTENVGEYKQWKEKRDKALREGKGFDEYIKIKWNEYLVSEFWKLIDEFWKRVRAYRFAVDYVDLWKKSNENWNDFIESLRSSDIDGKPEIDELERNKDLILFNLENLDKEKNFYDFRKFVFPEFYIYETPLFFERKTKDLIGREINGYKTYQLRYSFNFWYKEEYLTFQNKANFVGANFQGLANFVGITFQNLADFEKATFQNWTNFKEVRFQNEANFWGAIFQNEANFDLITFQNEVHFDEITFQDWTYFVNITFQNEVYFGEATFQKGVWFLGTTFQNEVYFVLAKFQHKANFWKTTFQSKVDFREATFQNGANFISKGKSLLFNLSHVQLSKDSYIEIRNLQTVRLVLNNINNITDSFLFFDTKIIKFEDLEENQREDLKKENYLPNIEIKNSILNNMKFINCDFSEAEQIEIENSSLTKAEFMNVDWGKITEERICPELFKNSPAKARDVYRQLKLALDNQKDHINANEFYSLEMKAYEKVLQQQEADFQEKLIFSIHKSVSDFGQSWTKPLTLIIMLTIGMMGLKAYSIFFVPLFLIYLIFFLLVSIPNPAIEFGLQEVIFLFVSAGFFSYVFGDFDLSRNLSSELLIKSITNFLNDFAKTLNPMKLFKENGKGLEFPYTLYSIAVAFLSYQMIVAIRKRVKR